MTNQHGRFDDLETYNPFPGIGAESFSTEQMTVTRYTIEPGGEFPTHHHPQEQSIFIERGEATFTAGGEGMPLEPGSWATVGPDVEHGLRAGPQGCRFICVISPPRRTNTDYSVTGQSTS